MLWETFFQNCTLQTKTTTSDGQGGVTTAWGDGNTFKAAIVKNTTVFDRVAEKQGAKASYTITTPITTTLKFHDIFKRNQDNKKFIVTSDSTDSQPPEWATFKFHQVTAEEWK